MSWTQEPCFCYASLEALWTKEQRQEHYELKVIFRHSGLRHYQMKASEAGKRVGKMLAI